jgi:hypothetical protein
MASTSEATIGKNVPNLGLLITNYTNMGEGYKPGKEAYSLTALNTLKTSAGNAHDALGVQWVDYRRVVAERAAAYQPLSKLVTRCLNIFLASDALEQVKDGARALARKIRGEDTSTPPPPPVPGQTPQENQHSTIQQSFAMIAENFGLFIEMLRAEPTYLPGKDDIKLAALDALLVTLLAKNAGVDTAFVLWKTKMSDRDKVFFDATTGLVDVALGTKLYVKGDFGTDSPEYNAIKGIKFTRKR